MKNYLRYVFALLAVSLAVLLRYALLPLIGPGLPYVTLFPVTVSVALLAGLGPAILTGILGGLAADYFFITPLFTTAVDIAHLTRLALVTITSAFVGYVGDRLRAARAKAEKQAFTLRESERRLKRSQEIAHLGSWELDLVNNVLTWSDEVYRIFGLQPQGFGATYEAFLEAVHPDDRAAVDAAYSGSLREGRDTYEIEHRVVRKSTGEMRFVYEKCEHVRDENGRIIRSAGMVHDITERKRSEEELRKAKDELELRVQERTAELRQANDELEEEIVVRRLAEERLFRLSRFYSVLSNVNEAIVRTHEPQVLFEEVCRILVEKGSFKLAWVGLLDKESCEVRSTAAYGETGYLDDLKIIAADVPEGKGPTGRAVFEGRHIINADFDENPDMLPWREKAMRHGLRSSSAFPIRMDSEVVGALTIYADKPSSFTGEELPLLLSLADNISFAIDSIAKEKQRLKAKEDLRRANIYNRSLIEASLDPLVTIDAGGKITDVNFATEKVTGRSREELIGTDFSNYFTGPDKARAGYKHVFSKGSVQDYPLEIRHRDGHVTPVLYNAAVYHDEAGNVIGVFAAARDITERKKAEEEIRKLYRELEARVIERTAQLEAANKELEAFAYSVSHDLRAPLRSIDGFSLALLEDCADRLDDTGKGHLERVRSAAAKMGHLIDALLNLSRLTRGELKRATVDLSSLARNVADELKKSEPHRRAEFVIADGAVAEGDPVMLHVVIENLLSNAWKFTKKLDAARIEFGLENIDGRPAYFVRDNGAGFDMAYADKLFTAFQRLHAPVEFPGLGIGLATVQRIIHRHGGRVWAEGEVEKGATMYFTLS